MENLVGGKFEIVKEEKQWKKKKMERDCNRCNIGYILISHSNISRLVHI
jgi:hypothetical protein